MASFVCWLSGTEFIPPFAFSPCASPLPSTSGLGFAAGAMCFVGVNELLPDAIRDLDGPLAAAVTALAFGIMGLVQWELHGVI